jgi:hypothetical protein
MERREKMMIIKSTEMGKKLGRTQVHQAPFNRPLPQGLFPQVYNKAHLKASLSQNLIPSNGR